MEIREAQQRAHANAVKRGWDKTPVDTYFCLTYGELAEAFQARKENNIAELGDELADVLIYTVGIAAKFDIDIDAAVLKKIQRNENREYKKVNGYYVKTKDEA